jgi:hypothetical protein
MISSSQMPCAGSAIQAESLCSVRAICVAMSLLRAQPGSTRSINTYVKTDVSFKQRRTEAEDSHGSEEAYSLSSTVPMVELRRACSRKQLSLRRSDALSHIQFFKKRKLQPK